MLFFALFALALSFPKEYEDFLRNENGETWAIVVAGANTYSNYWSQAQSCAAYQQLKKAGIKDDRIIHWLYDDVANSKSNPHPGELYLYEGGEEVYHDIAKDVTGEDLNVENFLKMLRGEDMSGIGSGKTLKSNSNDRIFIYFSDHGGDGIMYFPDYKELHVKDWINTLTFMHNNEMYDQMVIYLDTCHSGSMFNGLLPEELNIYAATSADPTHVAWLCDCYTKITPNGCMSNCWPKYWLLDTQYAMGNGTFNTRTLLEQYETCREETWSPNPQFTNHQTACNYGNMDIANSTLNVFLGTGETKDYSKVEHNRNQYKKESGSSVKMTEATWIGLQKKYEASNDISDLKALEDYERMMKRTDIVWESFANYYGFPKISDLENEPAYYDCYPKAINPDCQKKAIIAAKRGCGDFNEYSLQYIKYLTMACHNEKDLYEMEKMLKITCDLVDSHFEWENNN